MRRYNTIKIFAYITLILFVITFVVLIVCSFCLKLNDLGGLWKYFLFNWMKLQFVALLLLLPIYLSCCIREFLSILYRYAIFWDHAFASILNESMNGDKDFVKRNSEKNIPI